MNGLKVIPAAAGEFVYMSETAGVCDVIAFLMNPNTFQTYVVYLDGGWPQIASDGNVRRA